MDSTQFMFTYLDDTRKKVLTVNTAIICNDQEHCECGEDGGCQVICDTEHVRVITNEVVMQDLWDYMWCKMTMNRNPDMSGGKGDE